MNAWPDRLRRSLPGLWAGAMLALGGVAAPSLFALLERVDAGRVAGRLFTIEAQLSLLLCVVLGVLERRRAAAHAASGIGSRVSAEVLLVLGALFCTVLGHFAVQPMMVAARAGQGFWSFGALHAFSSALFLLKGLLVLTLAWRATRA